MAFRTLCISAVVAGAMGLASQAQAIQRISAPALDLKADLFTVPNGGIETSSTWVTAWGSTYQAPTWGAPAQIFPFPPPVNFGYGFVINTFTDHISWGGGPLNDSPERHMAAAAYIAYDDESLPTDAMTFYTVYGIDLSPLDASALSITGYDPNGYIPLLSGEEITGPSGAVYSASAGQLVALSDLSTLLGASADLSPFSGSASSEVWVFTTTVPFSEAAVPEPASLSILGLCGAAMLRRRARIA